MTTPLCVAVVGAGAIARDYLAVLDSLPEHYALVAVADVDERARQAAIAGRDVPAFASLAELFAEVTPDVALVLTPPATHETLTLDLLDRGAHVLCEKPLCLSVAAATRMFHVASRTGRRLMMASKFRYVADVVRAQQLLREGLLGELVLLENSFCARVPMAGRWNSDAAISGGGVLIDNGTHSCDLVCFLVGPIMRIFCEPGRRVQPLPVEDTARVIAEAQHGVVATIDLSWSISKESDWYVQACGSRGTLQLGWRRSRYRLAGQDWTDFGQGYDKCSALRAPLQNFAGVVRGGEPPAILPEDAIESVRVIEAAYRSLRAARWVPVHQLGSEV
jgi:predicted dehydrogenase